MFKRSLLLALAVGALSLSACSDDSGEDGGGSAEAGATGGVSQAPAEDCAQRCAEKIASCGAPEDVAAAECQGVCGAMLTEAELQCLEDEDCADLEQAFLGSGGACELGGGSASGGSASGGSASGGTTSGGTTNADIGDACECSGSDAFFESCSGTGSSCGELTCYVVFGDGICSQTCTADIDGDDCPSGECTEQIVNGISVGVWCVP